MNLPAHGVIIKGTELYDAARGGWVDVDILDVIQIFGRAGRPQFDTSGEGCLIGMRESVDKFARLMVMKVWEVRGDDDLDTYRVIVHEESM